MKRFSNILFVAAPSVDDTVAFARAVALAENNQAQISIVAVVDALTDKTVQKAIVEERQAQLCKLVQGLALPYDVEANILVGTAFIEIIREVLQNGRDLVIKSLEDGENVVQRLFGGTDMKLLRKCPCSLWLIQSTRQRGYRKILVSLGYEPENPENAPLNRQLLEMAMSLALSEFSELHLVHAWNFEHEGIFRSPRLGFTNAEVDEMVLNEER